MTTTIQQFNGRQAVGKNFYGQNIIAGTQEQTKNLNYLVSDYQYRKFKKGHSIRVLKGSAIDIRYNNEKLRKTYP